MKKHLFFVFLLSILISLFFINISYPQKSFGQKRPGRWQNEKFSPVKFRAYPMALNNNQYKVYLLVEVVYDFLQFTYRQENYTAKIQLEANLIHTKNNKVYSRIWNGQLSLDEFKLTNRRDKFFLAYDSLLISSGRYAVKLTYRDMQGAQKKLLDFKIYLPEITDRYISPPLYCDLSSKNRSAISILPAEPMALRENLFFNRPQGIFFNVWSSTLTDVPLKLKIEKEKPKKIVYQLDTLLTKQKNSVASLIKPPFMTWEEGKYKISLLYDFGEDSVKQATSFNLIWFDKPRSLRSLEKALQPIELITNEEEFDRLTDGNDEEKQRKFREFWKRQDPSPKTAYNEVLAEFYSRVDSANIIWGKRKRNGWQTDPGRVYVQYGKPDDIEDNSLNPENPYMRWSYQFPDRKLIFTFEALDGRKRYKLVDQQEVPQS